MRRQVFLTDTPTAKAPCSIWRSATVRTPGVEDRIRCGKNTGLDRLPSRHFAINAAWLELTLTVVDLLAWTQVLLLDGELASAEPKKLRYLALARRARA